MSSPSSVILLSSALLLLTAVVGFFIYIVVVYSPIVGQKLVEMPMFLPLRVSRVEGGEDVQFQTTEGLSLAGTYFKSRSPLRSGVIVFCHEYLSNRWSFQPYADHLRGLGFDVFTFDFRNHGESSTHPLYKPLHWVTDHEVRDLEAALAYLATRPDADEAGVGLYGISRGGGTALCVAAKNPRIWGVITDGAFPTRGTMLSYILRWAEIYVKNPLFWRLVPVSVFDFLGWTGRIRTGRKLHCRFTSVERAVARLAPRPWLAIHGQKDAYISVEVARALFDRAGEPKELWIVDGAKHNRCREKNPAAYFDRVSGFMRRFAPRSQPEKPVEDKAKVSESLPFEAVPIQANLSMVVPG